MNVRPLVSRLPTAPPFGADPNAAAQRAGAPLDAPEAAPETAETTPQTEPSLEDQFVVKALEAHKATAERQAKEFELNVRRADIINSAARARGHDGRTLCTPHDASVIWKMETLLHSMVGGKEPVIASNFEEPDASRPINSSGDGLGSGQFHGELLSAIGALGRNMAAMRKELTERTDLAKIVPADSDPGA